MNSNIKKFDSKEAFDAYRATDGWAYPSVNYITNNEESSIHYNNEFIMEWNDNDLKKVPYFYGDISHDEFKAKIDALSTPCEIKKDGTDFAELKMSGNNVADWNLRKNDSASHYSGTGKEDYLQMARIKNVNVGLFKDTKKGTKQIRFNFDTGCPEGFHKWFPNSTTGYKLFGRYDIMPNTTDNTTVDCCVGESQNDENRSSFTWSANTILSRIKATGNFLAETYWEHLVMSFLFCAYHKNFNTQEVYSGLQSGSETAARGYVNGYMDTYVTSHDGGHNWDYTENASSGNAYKFLHLENPLHGKQWIWGAGWKGLNGKYYLTFDDVKANAAATLATSDADIVGNYVTSWNQTYITNIDLYGVPSETLNGQSSLGFYDACWSAGTTNTSYVAFLGGTSYYGASGGAFARAFIGDASYATWGRRGRITMNE